MSEDRVVVHREEQCSSRPVGGTGDLSQVMSCGGEVWTDLRPLSLR